MTWIDDHRAAAMTSAGWWRNESLDQYLDRWATKRGGKTAAVDGASRLTWAELARTVERVAHGLQAAGLGRGSVISCQLPNWNEWLLLALAAVRLGAVLNPIPPTYRASELQFILSALETEAFVIPARFRNFDYVEMVTRLRSQTPALREVFVARGAPGPEMRPFTWLTDSAWEAREGRRPLAGTDPNQVAEVIFTSGTTGEPKGVMHTANTALSIIYPLIDRLRFDEGDVALMSSTFGHQTGYLYGYCLTLLLGSTGVWLDVWNAESAARLIAAERVTYTMGATPFLQDLTYTTALERCDLSSLRLFISAGAAIPRKLVQDARQRLRCAISAGWGMSENGLVSCNGLDDAEEKIFGTDGRPLAGMELSVVDGEGQPVPTRTEGDLLVRGHSQFVGYWKRPEFTREAHTTEGWFKTGDRAVLDLDGYVSITGRSKDLIIRGGENISVAEVENLLFAHPKIQSVAVVAMPDPRLVERACAFVITKPGQTLTLEDIVAYLDGHRLARHKFPERLELVSEFPMTPSGKIQKYRLRETIAAKLGLPPGALIPPRIWAVFVAYVLATAAIVLFSLLALLVLHEHEPGVPGEEIPATLPGLIAGGLASASGFAVTMLVVVRPLDLALIRLRPGRETGLTLALVILGTLTLSQTLDSALTLLGLDALGTPALIRGVLADAAGPQLFAAVVVLGVLVGIAEEAFFRGYMQSALRARWPPWAAVLGTSLAFALLHVDWIGLDAVHAGLVLALGLWLGFATERLDGALPAVAAHVVNNIVFTLQAATGLTVKGPGPNLWLGLACLLVFAVCLAVVARVPRSKGVC